MTLKRLVSSTCFVLVCIPTYALHAGIDNNVDFATPLIYALGPSEHLVNNQPEPVLAALACGPYSLLYGDLLVLVVLAPPLPLLAGRSDRLDLRESVIDGVLQAADLLTQQVFEGRLQLILQGV
jgi:hypothetical protein